MSQPETQTSYDALPYPSNPFSQTHPDHLATVAALFGLKPARADQCRVLELGCAAGGNLIPLAVAYPESRFVGIDLSPRQIEDGQKMIDALGLNNVDLRAASITDVNESYGQFDYIVCHGVYSWVPREVQEKILDINRERLQPHGVGYVSYNTFPGWHMRGMIRDMMCYHNSRFTDNDPKTMVTRARTLLDFLAKSVKQEKNPYGLMLQQELDLLRKCSDSYLYHEHLEECNDPVYFFEFHQELTARGLRYLGEADLSVMMSMHFPPEVRQTLNMLAPNQVQTEQYLDFLRNRTFRQTLVCHQQHQPNYNLRGEQVAAFQIASCLKPKSPNLDLNSNAAEVFHNPGNQNLNLNTTDPIVKAALLCLGDAWPQPIPFDQLRAAARARLQSGPSDDAQVIAQDTATLSMALMTVFAGASNTMVELWRCPPRFVSTISERPTVSPLARQQVAAGALQVANLRHQMVPISEFVRQLLLLMDGSRDLSALLYGLVKRCREKVLHVHQHGKLVTDEDQVRTIVSQTLDQQLPQVVASSLLVG